MIVAVAQSIELKFYGKNESCHPVTVHFEWFFVQIFANFEIFKLSFNLSLSTKGARIL